MTRSRTIASFFSFFFFCLLQYITVCLFFESFLIVSFWSYGLCCAVPPGKICSRRRRSAAAEPSGNGSSGAPCMAGMPQEIWDRGEAVFSVRLVWVILGCGAWACASEPGPAQGLFSRPRHVQVPVYDTGHRQGWQCMRMKSFSSFSSLRTQRGAVRYPGGQTVRSRIYSVFFNFCNKIYDFLPLRSSTSYVKWYQTFHDPVGWTAHTRHLFFGIFFFASSIIPYFF